MSDYFTITDLSDKTGKMLSNIAKNYKRGLLTKIEAETEADRIIEWFNNTFHFLLTLNEPD